MTSSPPKWPALVMMTALTLSGGVMAGPNHAGGHASRHADEPPIGKPGVMAKVQRTVTVDMSDTMRFTPANIHVKQGETLRLIVKNSGKVKHELNMGTQKELLQHLEIMKKFPGMEHDEPNMVSVGPGQQGEIVWQFTKAGTVHFACLVPGHYEAGMKGAIQVGKK